MSRNLFLFSTALTFAGSAAFAAGLERAIPSVAPLFEDGRYLEFSFSYVDPTLTGEGGFVPPDFDPGMVGFGITGSTGDLLDAYAQFGAAYKADINEQLSYAFLLNEPYGANTTYPVASAGPPDVTAVYNGSAADLESYALTALLAYDVNERVKVYGGPILQSVSPSASILFPAIGYSVEAETDYGLGFTFGAAYSIPDIALRVGLTYRSEIEHELDTIENSATLLGGPNQTQTNFETPDSLTLDFQTGIAENTLLFGQAHWVDWSEFAIAPPNYIQIFNGRPLVSYADDWVTYTLGVGRRFTDEWSGAVSVLWEPQNDIELTSLGPVDGRVGLNLGATYETETMKISGGINYTRLGNARNVLNTDFDDGDAFGFGFRIGFKL
ncbi:MAG: outer membrane protein transport protein [Pseudomonadota bacterium]